VSFLLDTCVLSELVKPLPCPGVVQWIDSQDEDLLAVSTLTFGELQKGIAKLPDSRRRQVLARWVSEDLQVRFDGRILPVDLPVALLWGELLGRGLRQGLVVPAVDGLLAATVLHHQLTLVTRNTGHFRTLGVPVFDPWTTTL